jgi:carbon monoxide dehydrogenase subunit G
MARIETDILVNQPADRVFDFLTAAANHARFIPGMLEFHQTSPGSLGAVGATARGVRRDLIWKTPVQYEITSVEPGRQLGMRGRMGPIGFEDGYILEPQGGRTRIRFWLELQLGGLLTLARPFVSLIGRVHAAETLANLKRVMEAAH